MATGRPRGSPGWPPRRARPRVGRRPSRAARLFVSEALSRHPPSSLIVPPTPADIARHGLTVVVAVTPIRQKSFRAPHPGQRMFGDRNQGSPGRWRSRPVRTVLWKGGTKVGAFAMSTHSYGLTVDLLTDASR